MKQSLASELQTLLNVETAMLENWYAMQKSTTQTIANNAQIRELVHQLFNIDEASAGVPNTELITARKTLDRALISLIDRRHFDRYMILNLAQEIVASTNEELLGRTYDSRYVELIAKAFDGETVVSPPFMSAIAQRDTAGNYRVGVPTMFIASPIRDPQLQVIGVLVLSLPPEKDFTRILQIGRVGESGETYAFNQEGLMVSNSRFDHDLILYGLLADQPDSKSILNLLIRDPGGDMTRGFRPKQRRAELL